MPRADGARTRERIIDAAAGVLADLGLGRATTKEIARAAGISEAALYKHFSGKEEIFIRVLRDRLPGFGATVFDDPDRAAASGVAENLAGIARAAVRFYTASFPIASSVFLERALLERHRASVLELGAGPRGPVDRLTAYLRTERDRGRIRADTDTEHAAALFVGACFQRGFFCAYDGTDLTDPELDAFATGLAETLMRGLAR
ncbi:MAG TPA: helix-turn-helix domain-containing protein [Streptosporangiaceae bacterium]|jgi:AcrR family transcriptional regulator